MQITKSYDFGSCCYRVLALMLVWQLLSLTSAAYAIEVGADLDNEIRNIFSVDYYTVTKIDCEHEGVSGQFQVSVEIEGRDYVLDLVPHSLRGDDFRVLIDDGGSSNGDVNDLILYEHELAVSTYRGVIVGEADSSFVAASVWDGQLSAVIENSKGEVWYVQPLAGVVDGVADGLHIIYSPLDVTPLDGICGVDVYPGLDDNIATSVYNQFEGLENTGNQVCEVAFDADYEFFTRNDSSIEKSVYDIEHIMNFVEFYYERDTQITYEITAIVVRSAEPDPYNSTDPGTQLGEFRDHWVTYRQYDINYDTAHLMTGKWLDGNIIGLAWVGVTCNRSWCYGLSESKWTNNIYYRAGVTAHELGHNWNAGHCDGDGDCYIMCSGIGGCSGDVTKFGSRSISAMTGYRDTAWCLYPEQDPLELPFFENFSTTTVDITKWTYMDGGGIDRWSSNEPSPPYALWLAATGTGEWDDEEIRSNFIRMSGVTSAFVGFYAEQRGALAGDQLVVEYWNDSLSWQELVRIVSNGEYQEQYVPQIKLLPANALHDEFRLRLRSEFESADSFWYIDNITVASQQVMNLNVGPLFAGQEAQIDISGGLANSEARLYYSLQGEGTSYIPAFNVVLELASVQMAGNPVVADGSGNASWVLRIPKIKTPRLVWIQAAQAGYVSNVVLGQVN